MTQSERLLHIVNTARALQADMLYYGNSYYYEYNGLKQRLNPIHLCIKNNTYFYHGKEITLPVIHQTTLSP